MEEDNELALVAMQVILNAGDARGCMEQAMTALATFDFAAVDTAVAEADDKILKAHNAQTGMIQRQAGGEQFEYSLLFVHAQDTLMTIDAELHMFKHMLPVIKALHAQNR